MQGRNMSYTCHTQQFANIVAELTQAEDHYHPKRTERRCVRSLSLRIQPLDCELNEDGESFWSRSRDISRRGLAFINSEPFDHEYLRVGLLEHDATVIAIVRHVTSIGDHYPLYLVGVEFILAEE